MTQLLRNRSARFYWGALTLLVTLVAVLLTRLITHVDSGANRSLGIAFDERNPLELSNTPSDLRALDRWRFEVPRVAITGYDEFLLIVTPNTRSVAIFEDAPVALSCAFSNDVESKLAAPSFVRIVKRMPLTPLALRFQNFPLANALRASGLSGLPAIRQNLWRTFIAVPQSLRAALRRIAGGEAVIRCRLPQPLTASPTFTERAMTLAMLNSNAGVVAFDLSTFDGIDDLLFSGGVEIPLAGNRVRILDRDDRLVSVEWADDAAREQRDILLVLIGGLAAVAAAMAIETIRPSIEKRTGST